MFYIRLHEIKFPCIEIIIHYMIFPFPLLEFQVNLAGLECLYFPSDRRLPSLLVVRQSPGIPALPSVQSRQVLLLPPGVRWGRGGLGLLVYHWVRWSLVHPGGRRDKPILILYYLVIKLTADPMGPVSPLSPLSPVSPVAPLAPAFPCAPLSPSEPFSPLEPFCPDSPGSPLAPYINQETVAINYKNLHYPIIVRFVRLLRTALVDLYHQLIPN